MYSTRPGDIEIDFGQAKLSEPQARLVESLRALGMRPLAYVQSEHDEVVDVALTEPSRRPILLRCSSARSSARSNLLTILEEGPFEAAFFIDVEGHLFDCNGAPIPGDPAKQIASIWAS